MLQFLVFYRQLTIWNSLRDCDKRFVLVLRGYILGKCVQNYFRKSYSSNIKKEKNTLR